MIQVDGKVCVGGGGMGKRFLQFEFRFRNGEVRTLTLQ